MAEFPNYSLVELAGFSGRPAASYKLVGYVATALSQAQLLFKLATCLTSWPDDPDDALLASYAVLSVGDGIYLAQQYSKAAASPFQSETIGSYSYTKMAKAVRGGLPTGDTWFDLAVDKLGVCDAKSVGSSSIPVFENDSPPVELRDGERVVIGPGRRYPYPPAVL